ncbi:endonuclease/exonuclease/phosphatase family protein [Winogradskyella sp. PG-2]|uniref:endonuclease/exonuclease/phosphatase family protein n=1 Tax=Winogradskyella sp. PG-2 TaxID=754409 RepID=UPI0004589770|nr:endonuclease/exonuclease/phosphatase family protein [Winogradskyella sp. PG-2]BAO76363.1 endonuclease/exonuclease/phosphatase family protein [Winogradskyella sp. PG-2]
MSRIVIIVFLQLFAYQYITAQGIENLSFGSDDTFEIITWNIEQFPKNDEITVSYVIDIIEALDVDILAIQEVNDISIFNQMISELSSYDGYLESLWFGGLAYIYKTDSIQINSIYEIYTTSEFWNYFPRSPMIMDLNYMGERLIIINNHFKCCGDGMLNIPNDNDEETRRYFANNLLKEYVDTNFTNENVIILGDLNDNLLDDIQNNVFQMILDDSDNYLFTDYEIAAGNNSEWSFPSWPSQLDHILITNELFNEFQDIESDIQTIKIDEYLTGGWVEYDENISDHRPVALKLMIDDNLSVSDFDNIKPYFLNYPNPFSSKTTFSFKSTTELNKIVIFNLNGQKIITLNINERQSSISLNADEFTNGIYIAKLVSNNNIIATRKIVIMK